MLQDQFQHVDPHTHTSAVSPHSKIYINIEAKFSVQKMPTRMLWRFCGLGTPKGMVHGIVVMVMTGALAGRVALMGC